jgi:hypothetical protein
MVLSVSDSYKEKWLYAIFGFILGAAGMAFREDGVLIPLSTVAIALINRNGEKISKIIVVVSIAVGTITMVPFTLLSSGAHSAHAFSFGLHIPIKVITALIFSLLTPLYQCLRLLGLNTISAGFISAIVLVGGFLIYIKRSGAIQKTNRKWLPVLALLLCAVCLFALPSNFREQGIGVLANRYFYLPFAFLSLIFGYWITIIVQSSSRRGAIYVKCLLITLLSCSSFLIFYQSLRWSDRQALDNSIASSVIAMVESKTISEVCLIGSYNITIKPSPDLSPNSNESLIRTNFTGKMLHYLSKGSFKGKVVVMPDVSNPTPRTLYFSLDRRRIMSLNE